MLDDARVYGAPKVRVLVSDDSCLVSDIIVHILPKGQTLKNAEPKSLGTDLKTALTQELVPSAEGDLDDAGELLHLLRGVVLDVGDSL